MCMPTGDKYKNFPIVKFPYKKDDGKTYVDVNVAGEIKTVRWYSKEEYLILSKMANNLRTKKTVYEKYGFDPETKTTLAIIGKTYPIKQKLKELGALYSKGLSWHIPYNENNLNQIKKLNLEFVKIKWEEMLDESGIILSEDAQKEKFFKEEEPPVSTSSEFVGEIGQKITVKVKLVKKKYFRSKYGTLVNSYIFLDQKDNVFVWFTTTKPELLEGNMYILTGTIKNHIEYNGSKENVLVRCKLMEEKV